MPIALALAEALAAEACALLRAGTDEEDVVVAVGWECRGAGAGRGGGAGGLADVTVPAVDEEVVAAVEARP